MVAPTGARKSRRDHAALPLSIAETVDEAGLCRAAGASVLHAHVRDADGEHVLDPALYRELTAAMADRAPGMLVQITSEAVGRYTPEQQAACIRAVQPQMASMCLREITADFSRTDVAADFFAWCDEQRVHLQHILFNADELARFIDYRDQGVVPRSQRCLLFVLGRYSVDFESEPAELDPFLRYDLDAFDWFTCAFGAREQECVLAAIHAGGHARVGFENNLYLPDGEIAANTAALVSSLVEAMQAEGYSPASGDSARALLRVRSA